MDYEKLSDNRLGETSAVIQQRVEAARETQRRRFGVKTEPGGASLLAVTCNADMRPGDIRQHCQMDEAGRALMKSAMRQLQLSARAYHRVLKLARTIADLAGCEGIQTSHLAEALQYRPKLGAF